MDVGGWLRSLGLEQYEAASREKTMRKETPHRTAGLGDQNGFQVGRAVNLR